MHRLDSTYWNKRYLDEDTGWDIGNVSTPLKVYFDQIENKNLKILIPGAGNSYEAEYLFNNGFNNVFVLDFSPIAIANFKQRIPGFPEHHIICENFFEHQGIYDLIIEQTFFCAIDPEQRKSYVNKTHELLEDSGKIVGLLFDDQLNNSKPPFGGCKEEYKKLFEPYFSIDIMERAYNSISPRSGRELFIKLIKKI